MLVKIGEEMWCDEFDLFMPGGMHFRGRMVVIRLSDGTIWLHSPIPINDALAKEIADLGEVKHIVAPCLYHHVHLQKCIERYPEARVYGAAGFDKKRPDIKFDEVLTHEAPEAWSSDMEQVVIDGVPLMNEVVFLHKRSETLLVTDLIFNIHEVANWQTRLLIRMTGAYKKLAQSRMWKFITKDKAAAKASVQKMLQWDFQRLVMAHGHIVEEDTKQHTEQALQWMLK